MNRYAIIGARLDMAAGLNVLVVLPSQARAREAFEQVVAELVDGETSAVIRRNGAEEIRSTTDGCIRFISQRDVRLRKHTADVVVVDRLVADLLPGDVRRIVLRSHVDEAVLPA